MKKILKLYKKIIQYHIKYYIIVNITYLNNMMDINILHSYKNVFKN